MVPYRSALLVGLIAYFAIMAYLSRKSMKELTEQEFFLANRSFGSVIIALTVTASWFGGASAIVSADEAYKSGISAYGIIGLPSIISLLVIILITRRVRALNLISQPEFAERRYNRLTRDILAVIVAWYMMTWAASQVVASGKFFSSFFGTSYLTGLLVCSLVVWGYSTLAGYRGVVYTDAAQSVLLVIGTVIVMFTALSVGGGFGEVAKATAERNIGDYFNPFKGFSYTLFYVLSFVMAWSISGEIWQRISSTRTTKDACLSMWQSLGIAIPLYVIMVVAGMACLPIFSEMPEGGVIPALASNFMGPIPALLVFVGISAAVMSTMDTAINTGALTLTEDIYHKHINPAATEKQLARVGQAFTTVMMILAIFVAIRLGDVLWVLWMASDILASGAFWPLVLGMYWEQGNAKGAISSMLAGGAFTAYNYALDLGLPGPRFWPGWPFHVGIGTLIGLIVFVVVSLLTKPDEEEIRRRAQFFEDVRRVY